MDYFYPFIKLLLVFVFAGKVGEMAGRTLYIAAIPSTRWLAVPAALFSFCLFFVLAY